MIPVYILTNDNHTRLLGGFHTLWNTHTQNYPVTVYGFNPPDPDIELPRNFSFVSLGVQRPASQWSDALMDMMRDMGHKWFILMLEDYWITRPVDARAIATVTHRYMEPDVLRIDLSGNRAAYKQSQVIGDSPGVQVVRTPNGTPYQMSFQAAVWNKESLFKILRAGETPWESEIEGSKRVPRDMRVLGTDPALLGYKPVYQKGVWKLGSLTRDQIVYLRGKGWL